MKTKLSVFNKFNGDVICFSSYLSYTPLAVVCSTNGLKTFVIVSDHFIELSLLDRFA